MVKKTITYKDFNNNERTEELYFHLTELDATELALEMPAGLLEAEGEERVKLLEEIGHKGILDFVKKLTLKAYGKKGGDDGYSFVKDEQIAKDFSNTMAFSAFVMSLVHNDELLAEFINGVMPVIENSEGSVSQ